MIRLKSLLEQEELIKCEYCSHSWKKSEGGKDPYVCHKCGYDIKKGIEGHENDRDMVTGVAEILKMVTDINNRKDIANVMIGKFRSENVLFDKDEFLKMCGC